MADTTESIRIEIDADIFARLLSRAEICASEIRSLDQDSKHTIWRVCLESCCSRK